MLMKSRRDCAKHSWLLESNMHLEKPSMRDASKVEERTNTMVAELVCTGGYRQQPHPTGTPMNGTVQPFMQSSLIPTKGFTAASFMTRCGGYATFHPHVELPTHHKPGGTR